MSPAGTRRNNRALAPQIRRCATYACKCNTNYASVACLVTGRGLTFRREVSVIITFHSRALSGLHVHTTANMQHFIAEHCIPTCAILTLGSMFLLNRYLRRWFNILNGLDVLRPCCLSWQPVSPTRHQAVQLGLRAQEGGATAGNEGGKAIPACFAAASKPALLANRCGHVPQNPEESETMTPTTG